MAVSYKYFSNQKVAIIKESISAKFQGSYLTLVLLLTFFCCKFFFGYIKDVNSTLYHETLIFFDFGIRGALLGYSLGRGIYCLREFFKTK